MKVEAEVGEEEKEKEKEEVIVVVEEEEGKGQREERRKRREGSRIMTIEHRTLSLWLVATHSKCPQHQGIVHGAFQRNCLAVLLLIKPLLSDFVSNFPAKGATLLLFRAGKDLDLEDVRFFVIFRRGRAGEDDLVGKGQFSLKPSTRRLSNRPKHFLDDYCNMRPTGWLQRGCSTAS